MKQVYVYGSINTDFVVKTPRLPLAGETIKGTDFFINYGGKGANQAVAVAKAGAPVHLIGALGRDSFGKDLLSELNRYQVGTTYVKTVAVATGSAVIILDNDNRIIVHPGANNEVKLEDFKDALKDAKAQDVFVTQFELPLSDVRQATILAKQKGLYTIVNPAPAVKIDQEFIKNIDLLILNESELEMITGESSQAGIKKLKDLGLKEIILTLGEKGSIYHGDNHTEACRAYKVDAIDTTAAGDTFIGYVAASLAKDQGIKVAIDLACAASALTVTQKGAMQSIPTLKEVQDFLKNNK